MLDDDTDDERYVGTRDLTRWPTPPGRWLARHTATVARHVSAHLVFYLTATIGAVLATLLSVLFAQVYDAVVDRDGVAGLDQPVLDLAIRTRTPDLTAVVNGFSQLGGPIGMPVIAALITALMVWRWRSRTPLVLMVIGAAGSLLITVVGKDVVGRSRPPLSEAIPPYEYAFSFPSGHALNSTVIAGVVAYLLLRRLHTKRTRALTVVLAVLWAVAMGLSRVYLGHHWLTDVMAAWAVGLAWLALLITAHRLFLTVRRKRRADAG